MIKTVINPEFEHLRKELSSIPETIAVCGTKIFQGRNRIYRATIGGIDLTVKEFRVPSLANRIAYTFFRKGKARRSYDNAMTLGKLGIGTPEPIAYIEERAGGLLRRSYYVCRYWEGDVVGGWEHKMSDSGAMLESLARFTLTLHQKGVYHKDFSQGNILYRRDKDGGFEFVLVDINRMLFGVHDTARLYRNFRSINIQSEHETVRFAEAYARVAGLDEEKMRTVAVGMLQQYMKEKALHHRLKKLIGTMRKTIYLLFAVIAAAVCTACGNSAFSIEGKLTDAGTQNLRIVYQAGDSIVSQWVPAVNGEFKVDGKASDLSVVYLYSAQMQLIAHLAVEGSDHIKIEGSIADRYNLKVTGSDINEQWNDFIRAHAADFKAMRNDRTDKAIADYIDKNPKNVVSTLLLTCDYSDISSPNAQALLKKIDKAAKPEQLLSLYSQFLNSGDLTSKKVASLKLRNDQDSLVIVRTYDHPATILFFWRNEDSDRQTTVNSLKTLCRGSRLQMVDICLDSDTLDWRRTIDGDSVKWGHYKAIGGVVDKTIVDLNVKGSPYFIVADSTGTQIYRGTQFDKLCDVLNKKKIK